MKTKFPRTYKYSLVFLIAILASCQQKLVPRLATNTTNHQQTLPESKDTLKAPVKVIATPLRINTSVYSIEAGIAAIYIRDKQYDAKVRDKVRAFYTLNGGQTQWLGQQAPTDLYEAFNTLITGSFQYGLQPDEYMVTEIDKRLGFLYATSKAPENEIYNLDIQITGMFFLFTTHLTEGRIKHAGYGNKIWIKERDATDDVAILLGATETSLVIEAVNRLHPDYDQYLKLQAALEKYRSLSALEDDAPVIYASEKIKPDDINPVIPIIRRKLSLTDMKPDSIMMDSLRYDEKLASAVKWFQVRHGLEPDGVIGAGTLKFLNQSFKQKVEIIELNLERMRWLPKHYGDNYIVVNIPEYKLRVFENQKQQLEMKVIVGAEGTPTPVFSDTLWYAVFSPTWAVPNSIIRDEIIPRLQRDSTYYSGKNYTFYKNGTPFDPSSEAWSGKPINSYAYNVVQQPGSDNALGLVKFIMPNKMNIYLHDTPNHRLFSKNYRALSHGCVRLDDPDKLAEFLLKDRGWDYEKIDKAMHSNVTQTIYLKKPYRVQIEYRTAWVDDQGLVNFRDDVYGHDRRQLMQLNPSGETVASN